MCVCYSVNELNTADVFLLLKRCKTARMSFKNSRDGEHAKGKA